MAGGDDKHPHRVRAGQRAGREINQGILPDKRGRLVRGHHRDTVGSSQRCRRQIGCLDLFTARHVGRHHDHGLRFLRAGPHPSHDQSTEAGAQHAENDEPVAAARAQLHRSWALRGRQVRRRTWS